MVWISLTDKYDLSTLVPFSSVVSGVDGGFSISVTRRANRLPSSETVGQATLTVSAVG